MAMRLYFPLSFEVDKSKTSKSLVDLVGALRGERYKKGS